MNERVGNCELHERETGADETCDHFKRYTGRGPSKKSPTVSRPSRAVVARKLGARAKTIAAKRNHGAWLSHFNEVFHTAHKALCVTHMDGQKTGMRMAIADLKRLVPQPDQYGDLSEIQRAQAEILTIAQQRIANLDTVQPEPPSTTDTL
ncbi:MAG: hypothetical protein AAGI12_15500 [Pseudomonadota bacterium]